MTDKEAHAEAQRRWGKKGGIIDWVSAGTTDYQTHVDAGKRFEVGYSEMGERHGGPWPVFHCCGAGPTWEAAFTAADQEGT